MDKALAIAGIGLLILVSGLVMPTQQTQSATSCVDSEFDAADGCVETTFTVPNYGKSLAMGIGFVVVVVGVGASYTQSKSGSETTMTTSSGTEESDTVKEPASVETDVSMLHEQVQSDQEDSN